MQIRPPLSGVVRPFRISVFSLGKGYNKFSFDKYIGGGQYLLYSYLLSANEWIPIGIDLDMI